jgi:hypothetical protein
VRCYRLQIYVMFDVPESRVAELVPPEGTDIAQLRGQIVSELRVLDALGGAQYDLPSGDDAVASESAADSSLDRLGLSEIG